MTISLTVEISKSEVKNFSGLVREIYRIALGIGRELLKTALEQLDDEVLDGRDTARYRCKGFQKTCIKTILGAVEYRRRVYVDEAAVESKRRVLDNKVAYASFESVREFHKTKEGVVASRFDIDEIVMRVHNGDGARWIRKLNGDDYLFGIICFFC